MPFYRLLLVTRNDLAIASIYNQFVTTVKYVINNGGAFQRIMNTGEQAFKYPLFCKANSKTYDHGPMFFMMFCSSPQVMEHVCSDLKSSTHYLRIEKEKVNPMSYTNLNAKHGCDVFCTKRNYTFSLFLGDPPKL